MVAASQTQAPIDAQLKEVFSHFPRIALSPNGVNTSPCRINSATRCFE